MSEGAGGLRPEGVSAMLSITLKVLSILGILLLCLLGLVILLVLLALFFPVSYRLKGRKDAQEMSVCVRVSWLFGLLRVLFDYPEPGKILVKVLPFTVFDSGKGSGSDGNSKESSVGAREKPERESGTKEEGREEKKEGNGSSADPGQGSQTAAGRGQNEEQAEKPEEKPEVQEPPREETDSADPLILKKFKKIKYTICSIYDKIKNIWENISYYIELLQEEETKLLFSHVICRLGKILKSIRPRRIRGQILFGTGSPDTTGYACGIYGMLSPFLGGGLAVEPDFTEAVLDGNIFISGHITLFTIIWNGLKILLDKNLRRFIKKIKAGRKR